MKRNRLRAINRYLNTKGQPLTHENISEIARMDGRDPERGSYRLRTLSGGSLHSTLIARTNSLRKTNPLPAVIVSESGSWADA